MSAIKRQFSRDEVCPTKRGGGGNRYKRKIQILKANEEGIPARYRGRIKKSAPTVAMDAALTAAAAYFRDNQATRGYY